MHARRSLAQRFAALPVARDPYRTIDDERVYEVAGHRVLERETCACKRRWRFGGLYMGLVACRCCRGIVLPSQLRWRPDRLPRALRVPLTEGRAA